MQQTPPKDDEIITYQYGWLEKRISRLEDENSKLRQEIANLKGTLGVYIRIQNDIIDRELKGKREDVSTLPEIETTVPHEEIYNIFTIEEGDDLAPEEKEKNELRQRLTSRVQTKEGPRDYINLETLTEAIDFVAEELQAKGCPYLNPLDILKVINWQGRNIPFKLFANFINRAYARKHEEEYGKSKEI